MLMAVSAKKNFHLSMKLRILTRWLTLFVASQHPNLYSGNGQIGNRLGDLKRIPRFIRKAWF
jgi:hypothetical protein